MQVERKKLLTREMQAALDHGPDWVKDHLDTGEIEKVRQFLAIEEKIEFRCRGGGVAKNPDNAAGSAVRECRRGFAARPQPEPPRGRGRRPMPSLAKR